MIGENDKAASYRGDSLQLRQGSFNANGRSFHVVHYGAMKNFQSSRSHLPRKVSLIEVS